MSEQDLIDTSPFDTTHVLSTGATGAVWAARGPDGAEAVVKVARSPDLRASLAREAAVLSACRHPSLPALLGADTEHKWIALEYVPGKPAHKWAQGRQVTDVLDMGLQVLRAMAHLHTRGVIHGDIKPANVLVDDLGSAHLVDLSAAERIGTTPTGFKGTLGFVAPERLENAPIHVRMDVYGLGSLLYRCLTGHAPFEAQDPAALAYLPLVSLPAPPSSWRPELSSLVNQLLLALLTRTPERRPDELDRISKLLDKAADSQPSPPIVGMLAEREQLRQAVVGARDGETRVVVVYGPPGSGRRTLITEAVEAARREGLPYVKNLSPSKILARLEQLDVAPVVVVRRNQKGAARLARTVLDRKLPALVLVHAYRPEPQLAVAGAVQITPPPLTRAEAEVVVRHLGADPVHAQTWWRQSLGLPLGITGRVRRCLRDQGEEVQRRLPQESERILAALTEDGETYLPTLADKLSMSEHALLDHCEVLFAEGLVTCARGGAALRCTD